MTGSTPLARHVCSLSILWHRNTTIKYYGPIPFLHFVVNQSADDNEMQGVGELFVDRQRQAAVVLGERDLAGDVRAKRRRDAKKGEAEAQDEFEYLIWLSQVMRATARYSSLTTRYLNISLIVSRYYIQYVSKVPTSPPVYGTLAEMSELLKHTVYNIG